MPPSASPFLLPRPRLARRLALAWLVLALTTLLEIVAEHKGGDNEAAYDYLSSLQREGRYARDVY